MKQTGMLVVSLRGVNFGFWSRLGCSGQSANILSRQGPRRNTELREIQIQIFFLTCFVYRITSVTIKEALLQDVFVLCLLFVYIRKLR